MEFEDDFHLMKAPTQGQIDDALAVLHNPLVTRYLRAFETDEVVKNPEVLAILNIANVDILKLKLVASIPKADDDGAWWREHDQPGYHSEPTYELQAKYTEGMARSGKENVTISYYREIEIPSKMVAEVISNIRDKTTKQVLADMLIEEYIRTSGIKDTLEHADSQLKHDDRIRQTNARTEIGVLKKVHKQLKIGRLEPEKNEDSFPNNRLQKYFEESGQG